MRRGETHSPTSDKEFIELFTSVGAHETARRLHIDVRNVFKRRLNMELHYGVKLKSPQVNSTRRATDHAEVVKINIKDGIVLVGSDAHIWPGNDSIALRAFLKFAKDMAPAAVIMNGDVLDFPQISRHPPIGHNKLPDLSNEIEEAQAKLHDFELAVKRSCKLVWTLGNHDGRFETRLATVAPEYARLHGHSLKDHFPAWTACWRTDLNDSVIIKHRFKGGIHATHNNAMWSGKTIITGHLHSQKVTPFTDYNGTRWGVDTGCLADPGDQAFIDYTEANPLNWRSGFCVLTFTNGQLLPPELVSVWDKKTVTFRGQLIKV